MANTVDDGGSLKPVQIGPKTSALKQKQKKFPPIKPKKPSIPTAAKPLSGVDEDVFATQDSGMTIPPIPTAASPLNITNMEDFLFQDSAKASQVVNPLPGYVPGQKPTQDELDAIWLDILRHPEMQTTEWLENVGLTPQEIAKIKNRIPFSMLLPQQDLYHPKPPTTPTPTPGDDSGDGYSDAESEEGGELAIEEPVLPPITWEEKYHAEGAPDWWRGLIPSRNDPQTTYASLLNSMIPYMSPEDQRYTASVLYRLYPEYFSSYNPERVNMGPIPTTVTTDTSRWMSSLERANQILSTLDRVKSVSASGAEFGPGYSYLRQLGSVLRDMGGRPGAGQSRQQYQQMMSALDPLAAETKQEDLSAYSALTRMLTQPYYTAGQVTPTSQLQTGETVFGQPKKNWY